MKIKNAKRGFSLVELLVVVTIIAILSVTAFVALGGQTVRARDSKRQQDLTIIQSSLEQYYLEFSRYPAALAQGAANEDGTDADALPDWLIPKRFLSRIPTDPNGPGYIYALAAGGQSYEMATTLEGTGIPGTFRAYVIGNSETALIQAGSGAGQEAPNAQSYNATSGELASCTAGTSITNMTVDFASAPATACIPYDPR